MNILKLFKVVLYFNNTSEYLNQFLTFPYYIRRGYNILIKLYCQTLNEVTEIKTLDNIFRFKLRTILIL